MMRSRIATILVAMGLLCGCTSIPLSTALRLSSLSPSDLAAVDPAQVRVAVSVPSGYTLDIGASRLTLHLAGPEGSRGAEMHLSLLGITEESRKAGWFRPNVRVSTYMLALSPQGALRLRELQQFLVSTRPRSFEFSVSAPIVKSPPGAREVTLWVALKLYPDKPFMRLIDGAILKYDVTRNGRRLSEGE